MANFQIKTNASNNLTVEAARYRQEGEWVVFRAEGDDDYGVPVLTVRADNIHWISTTPTAS